MSFREAVEQRDADKLREALHPEVIFRSPAVFKPYEGREAVMGVLQHVLHVFEDFHYTDELQGDSTHGLVFEARVGDKQLQGWDYLTLDGDGLVTELVVMIRPASGLMAVAQAMGARIAAASSATTGS